MIRGNLRVAGCAGWLQPDAAKLQTVTEARNPQPGLRAMRTPQLASLVLLSVIATGFSCESPTEPEFEISFTGPSTVGRGTSKDFNLSISHGDDVGTVTLSLPSFPAGVSGSLSKTTITSADDNVTLTLTAAIDAPLGNGVLRIAAKGDEIDETTDLSVVVEVTGDYAVETGGDLSIYQGESKDVTITIAGKDGFNQAVALSVGPALTGITTSIAPSSITGSGPATLTITATADALTGTRTLNVTGKTEGLTDRVGVINLSISQKPAVAIMGGNTINLTRGGTNSFGVSISRTNYTGNVSLTVGDLPAGVTLSPNPIPMTNQSNAVAQVAVAANATPGSYTIALSATASGITIPSVTMTLTILN